MSQLQVTGEAKIRDIQGPVVANSGVVTALDGAASQYVRGDGTLADFPTSSGGGSSVSYYLNSSVSQGTIGGVAYRELSKDPIIGTGTDIAISSNGYVANYITDVNDPDVTIVAGGNFNCEFYFSVSNDTGNPFTYAELYKYDGTTFTLLGSSVGVPEYINQGTTIAPYYFAIPVATASLALTDRLAIRIYVNVDGRTVTLHTENGHLCQVVTTLSKGMVSLNNLTDQSQFLTTGTSGTNFAIASTGDTHTFNLPVASATNTGKLSSTDWSTFNGKVPYTGATGSVDLGVYSITSNAVKAIGDNSTYGGVVSIKQNNVIGGLIGTGYTELFGKTNSLGISFGSGSIAYLSNSVLTADRTFTLPDLSGTLALLEGTQTFSGNKTFSALTAFTFANGTRMDYGLYLSKGAVPSAFTSLTTNIYSDATTNNIVIRDNSSIAKLDFNNSTQTYTFPASSGTIALTSNIPSITGLVPYTGATASVDLGVYALTAGDISASNLNAIGLGTQCGYLFLKQGTAFLSGALGYSSINASATKFLLTANVVGSNNKEAIFELGSLTNNTQRTFTLPDASGTLALTSNLSAYLPLTGGTLSGSLSASTYYSSAGIFLSTSGQATSGSGYATINGGTNYLDFRPANGGIFLFQFPYNTTRTFTLPDATGTIALTSNLSAYLPLAGGTLTGALSGTSATFSSNTGVLVGASTRAFIRQTSGGDAEIGAASGGLLSIFNNGSSALSFAAGGAATFSSSVTATSASTLFKEGYIIRATTTSGAGSQPAYTYYTAAGSKRWSSFLDVGSDKFFIANAANSELFTIQQNGNIGIGTSSPSSLLHLQSATASGTSLLMTSAGGGTALTYRQVLNETSQQLNLVLESNHPMVFWTNSVERMRIQAAGSINMSSLGTGTVTATSGTLSTVSDMNLKDEDGFIDNALEKVLKLKPRYFHWKEESGLPTDLRQLGFYAQEVNEALGEEAANTPKTENDKWGIYDRGIIAFLTAAIQEQQAQIEELKALINK